MAKRRSPKTVTTIRHAKVQRSNILIADFRKSGQEYYICYFMASIGFKRSINMLESSDANRTNTIYFGSEHPDKGQFDASLNIGEYLDSFQNGGFQNLIAKSFVTAIYAEWDELYRFRIAEEFGVQRNDVKSDLMGDVRLIRNYIVHSKSVVPDKHKNLKELDWSLSPGELWITGAMFRRLIDQINQMQVKICSFVSQPSET